MNRIAKYSIDIFDIINDLRLQVLVNFLFVTSWFLYSSGVDVERSVECAVVATLVAGFGYVINRYTDYEYDLVVDKGLKKANRETYLIVAAVFLVMALLFIFKDIRYAVPILLGVVLGTLYSVKTFFRYPIKNFFLVKNFFASGSKYIATMIGVWLFHGLTASILLSSVLAFLSFFIYEIIWDIRDIESDKVGNVKTIPGTFGKETALTVCAAILALSFVYQLAILGEGGQFFYITHELALFFITSLLFVKSVRWFHIMVYAHIFLRLFFVNKEIILYMQHYFQRFL